MKQQYKTNMITKSQGAIAYFLVICQLLTSCGGKYTILPRDLNAQPKTLIEQQTRCTEDSEPDGHPKPTSFIDGTPLKLGQEEIRFTWDPKEGLQAFTIDPSMGFTATYVPVGIPLVINPGNGWKEIVLSELNQEQAEAVVKNFKWEVNKGELKQRGGRLRGGMRKANSSQGVGQKWVPRQQEKIESVVSQTLQEPTGESQIKPTDIGAKKWWEEKDKVSWLVATETGESLLLNKSTNEVFKWNKSTQQPEKLPRQKRHSECTDCSGNDPDQHQNYHVVALGVVKDFFREHFKTSPYLTAISTITHSIHSSLAGDHNKKRDLLIDDIKNKKGVLKPKDKVKIQKTDGQETTYTLNGLNVVVAFISFIDEDRNEMKDKRMYIKCGGIEGIEESIFKSLDRHKNGNDHVAKREYDEDLIKDFNKSISDLLNKEPNLLKPHLGNFKNPLLTRNGQAYNGETKVYNLIYNKIIKELQERGTINKGEAPTSEQERIILKSIVASRRHSEEALAEYLRSDEFSAKFMALLGAKDDKDVKNKVQDLKIHRVRIDVHSTKESCLPCQVTLRAVKHALEEKFFNKDVADAEKAADEIFQLQISSQGGYDQDETKYDDITSIQYEGNPDIVKFVIDDKEMYQTTAYIDAVFEYGCPVSESLNSSYKLKQETERADKETAARKVAEEEVEKEKAARLAIEEAFKTAVINMIQRGMGISEISLVFSVPEEKIKQIKLTSDSETATSSAGHTTQ